MSVIKNPTRDQIMDALNGLDRNKTSIEADLKDVTEWEVDNGKFNVTLNGQSYHFRSWAKSQLLKKLRIPERYFDVCSTDLKNKELREGFENLSRGSKNHFKIWVNPETNEQSIYGIIPTKCSDLLTGEIAEKVFNGLGSQDGVFIDEFDYSLEDLRIRFANKNSSFIEVDEQFPAVDFVFSEVLKKPIKLQSVLFRKVCSNGAVVPSEINQSFVMPLTRFKSDIFDLQIQYVDNAASGLDAISKALESLKTIALPLAMSESDEDNRNLFDDVFEYVLPAKSLRKDYDALIRAEYNKEGNLTANGVVNATTKIARDLLDLPETKVSLESAAGMFISKVASVVEETKDAGETFAYTKENLDKIFKKKRKSLGTPATDLV